jgi:hypothetical protein
MKTSPFTSDTVVKRLRWVMVCVILFDFLVTWLGQPGTYWLHPETANEGNSLFKYFMAHGLGVYVPFVLAYIAVAFLVASMGCKRGALIAIFSYILGHYFGACSWLANHWGLGTTSIVVYGILLATIVVRLAFPRCDESLASDRAMP